MSRGVITGERGERYLIAHQDLLDTLLESVVGHEIDCGVNHLLAAAALCLEASAQLGMPRLEALLIASFFRLAAERAERIANSCPEDPSTTPRAVA
jgi:hypothetical protein